MRRLLPLMILAACSEPSEPAPELPAGLRDLGQSHGFGAGEIYEIGTLMNMSEDDLYRLERLGIRTVVSFRTMQDIEMNGKETLPDGAKLIWAPVRKEGTDHETTFLRAVSDPENLPMVVQCADGTAARLLRKRGN
ncbi:MAG: tyrosine-protein phosphatase [Planctomycetota bacterium]|jgi:hypothetical protein